MSKTEIISLKIHLEEKKILQPFTYNTFLEFFKGGQDRTGDEEHQKLRCEYRQIRDYANSGGETDDCSLGRQGRMGFVEDKNLI